MLYLKNRRNYGYSKYCYTYCGFNFRWSSKWAFYLPRRKMTILNDRELKKQDIYEKNKETNNHLIYFI